MLLGKCENCDKRDLWPRKRRYNFDFLPLGPITSEDKLCTLCFKKVIWGIRKTHNQLKPTLLDKIKNLWKKK